MKQPSQFYQWNFSSQTAPLPVRAWPALSATEQRLAKGFAWLDRLDWERSQGRNPLLGRILERIVVWRELVELELQEVEEQVEQICATAGNAD